MLILKWSCTDTKNGARMLLTSCAECSALLSGILRRKKCSVPVTILESNHYITLRWTVLSLLGLKLRHFLIILILRKNLIKKRLNHTWHSNTQLLKKLSLRVFTGFQKVIISLIKTVSLKWLNTGTKTLSQKTRHLMKLLTRLMMLLRILLRHILLRIKELRLGHSFPRGLIQV